MNVRIKSRTLRASALGYIIIPIPCMVMAILAAFVGFFRGSSCSAGGNSAYAEIMYVLGIALLWSIWHLGFKISIDNKTKHIIYRDGFFMTSKVSLSDITDVRVKNIKRILITKKEIIIPRMIVSTKNNKKALQIYIKPFRGDDIQSLQRELKTFCNSYNLLKRKNIPQDTTAEDITNSTQIKPGDIYEDSFYHPCLCTEVEDYSVFGISLIDGSYPRGEDIELCGVKKLTVEEVVRRKIKCTES